MTKFSITHKIKDSKFENLIRCILNKNTDDITNEDMEKIEQIEASNLGISDISGIEYCTNLKILKLCAISTKGFIREIDALGGLINLIQLDLSNNLIGDISALSNLINLKILRLNANPIDDISALSELINLTELDLRSNIIIETRDCEIKKINLNGCTEKELNILLNYTGKKEDYDCYKKVYEKVKLNNIFISDISALSKLLNLRVLRMGGNDISDVTPLSGLNKLVFVLLENNSVNDYSPLSHVKFLNKAVEQNIICDDGYEVKF